MAEIFECVAGTLWIFTGLYLLHWLRKWNRKFSELLEELKEDERDRSI